VAKPPRLTVANLLFAPFRPSPFPVGAIHGTFPSRWSAETSFRIPLSSSFSFGAGGPPVAKPPRTPGTSRHFIVGFSQENPASPRLVFKTASFNRPKFATERLSTVPATGAGVGPCHCLPENALARPSDTAPFINKLTRSRGASHGEATSNPMPPNPT
jgi:hypothetical protein